MLAPSVIIEAVVPLYLDAVYNYVVPAGLGTIEVGMRVLVPFGKRTLTAYTVKTGADPVANLKAVIAILDREPLFTPSELDFFRWAASYYLHPLGEVLKTALPAGINIVGKKQHAVLADGTIVCDEILSGGREVKQETFYRCAPHPPQCRPLQGRKLAAFEQVLVTGEMPAQQLRRATKIDAAGLRYLVANGWLSAETREIYRDPFRDLPAMPDTPPVLTMDQEFAVQRIRDSLNCRKFTPFLLHGVTGSGKTEVYLQAISHTLALGRSALALVPEIALTPQLVRRFRARFGNGVAVLHSGLTPGERFDEWRRIRRGEATIVIGARSAIFAPLENIGIIVVDEEHEASYKQGDGFRYNARDLALVRGKMANSCVVLGSATPQVVTWHAAQTGRIGLIELPKRVRDLPMPEIALIEMRSKKGGAFSAELVAAMEETLASGGQTLLFLNRRGYATFLVCQDCGHTFRCPNCAVSLTHHRSKNRHYCHYCDYSIPAPSLCPACNGSDIILLGRGTEKVEDEVLELLPSARIARMDKDTTGGRGGHSRILTQVENKKIDILVGTQMVAKGHDFPGVTLVGVISVDASLNLPDFRSAERTFQLLTQVSGRAGRGTQPGRVLIQTMAPDNYAIISAMNYDCKGFCEQELRFRAELDYPPFSFLALVELSSTSEAAVNKSAQVTAAELSRQKRALHGRVNILGPAAAPLAILRGRHRRQILLKAKHRNDLHQLLRSTKEALALPSNVRLSIDIDPLDML